MRYVNSTMFIVYFLLHTSCSMFILLQLQRSSVYHTCTILHSTDQYRIGYTIQIQNTQYRIENTEYTSAHHTTATRTQETTMQHRAYSMSIRFTPVHRAESAKHIHRYTHITYNVCFMSYCVVRLNLWIYNCICNLYSLFCIAIAYSSNSILFYCYFHLNFVVKCRWHQRRMKGKERRGATLIKIGELCDFVICSIFNIYYLVLRLRVTLFLKSSWFDCMI